jgi:S-adenosylmethionine:diacylglycerol 3-amino-3-carboxypropyl transferase
MRALPTPDATAWRRGRLDRRVGPPELLFGWMYEDSAVELEAFEPGGRVFCVASAGCTAFDLARRGDDVTAVDINPAQVEYVRARLRGERPQEGKVDRWLGRLRRLAPALGWSRDALEHFCGLAEPDDQLDFWRRRLDTRRLRIALAAGFSPVRLRRVYPAPFVAVLPERFDRVLLRRFERGFARHPNASNPHAAALLLGRARAATPAPLTLQTADAVDFLERCERGSFDAFSLSNILDGADDRYAERLLGAVRRAAAPGAVAVLRSLGEPANERQAHDAAADRAFIWGSITVEQFE